MIVNNKGKFSRPFSVDLETALRIFSLLTLSKKEKPAQVSPLEKLINIRLNVEQELEQVSVVDDVVLAF